MWRTHLACHEPKTGLTFDFNPVQQQSITPDSHKTHGSQKISPLQKMNSTVSELRSNRLGCIRESEDQDPVGSGILHTDD